MLQYPIMPRSQETGSTQPENQRQITIPSDFLFRYFLACIELNYELSIDRLPDEPEKLQITITNPSQPGQHPNLSKIVNSAHNLNQ